MPKRFFYLLITLLFISLFNPKLVKASCTKTINPGANLQSEINNLTAGSTLCLNPGSYNISSTLTFANSGTTSAPIVLTSANPDNKAIIVGGLFPKIRIQDKSNIEVSNLKFFNFQCGGIHVRAENTNVSNITIKDNHFENQTNSASCQGFRHLINAGTKVYTLNISNLNVSKNFIKNTETGSPASYDETITFYGNVTRSTIADNTLLNVSYIGIDLIGYRDASGTLVYGQPSEIVVKNNYIDGLKKTNIPGVGLQPGIGIYTDGPKGPLLIEGNTVKNASGIYVNSEPFAWGPGKSMVEAENVIVRKNIVDNRLPNNEYVYNLAAGYGSMGQTSCYAYLKSGAFVHNTFIHNRGQIFNVLVPCGQNIAIANNIIQTLNPSTINLRQIAYFPSGGEVLVPFTRGYVGFKIDGNLYSSNAAGFNFNPSCGYKSNLSGWQSCGYDTNSPAVSNPNLDSTYKPQNGSSAIDRAVPLTLTQGSGNNTTTLTVQDAKYFTNGFSQIEGDKIVIGNSSQNILTVVNVNYTTNTLTLDKNITYSTNQPVYYAYSGSKPDIGAVESGLVVVPTPTPTPSTSVPTPTPTPSTTPVNKYDVDENGVVDLGDIIDFIKYIFGN